MRSASRLASIKLTAVPLAGCLRRSLFSMSLNFLRSSARSMASGLVPIMGAPAFLSASARFSRGWPADRPAAALRLLLVDDIHHVFQRDRLEIQPVGRVIIGGNRLRVAINHDGLEAGLFQREGCVTATVIEFYPLPDAVGAAAQNHHFGPRRRFDLIFLFVGRIIIWRKGLKLRRTGVD